MLNNKKLKTIEDRNKTDRIIARMILGVGLSLSIASAVACGITHPKLSDAKDAYWSAKDAKDAYLDAYEQTEEFKTIYNVDVNALNERLIAREIDAYTYESELKKLNDNEYTEKVLIENAGEQTKSEFNKINQQVISADKEFYKYSLPSAISSLATFTLPLTTAFNYYLWKPRKEKCENLEDDFKPHISEETFKRVMILKDTPYHPINAEETKGSVEIVHDEKLGVLRAVENQPNTAIPNRPRSIDACIIKTEEQENENTL